jgi:hypothetical protein
MEARKFLGSHGVNNAIGRAGHARPLLGPAPRDGTRRIFISILNFIAITRTTASLFRVPIQVKHSAIGNSTSSATGPMNDLLRNRSSGPSCIPHCAFQLNLFIQRASNTSSRFGLHTRCTFVKEEYALRSLRTIDGLVPALVDHESIIDQYPITAENACHEQDRSCIYKVQ